MSRKYKFGDNSKLHFVTFTVTNWIDLFVREEYNEILLDGLRYCQKNKGLEIYAYCLMTSHIHLIIGTTGNSFSNIMRDLKRHSSEILHLAIRDNLKESRREWLIWHFERAAAKNANSAKFQLWQPECHPIELTTPKMANQKLDYCHYNPVLTGFVRNPEDWKYSSAIDYRGGEGLIEIILIDPVIM